MQQAVGFDQVGNLLGGEPLEQRRQSRPVAGAAVRQRRRGLHAYAVFMEEAVERAVDGQGRIDELGVGQRIEQDASARPVLLREAARLIARDALDEGAAGARRASPSVRSVTRA